MGGEAHVERGAMLLAMIVREGPSFRACVRTVHRKLFTDRSPQAHADTERSSRSSDPCADP